MAPPAAYVEAHIEQGPILDAAGAALGDVAAIVGMAGFTVTFRGASGHAGTVPMEDRRDAFSACASSRCVCASGRSRSRAPSSRSAT